MIIDCFFPFYMVAESICLMSLHCWKNLVHKKAWTLYNQIYLKHFPPQCKLFGWLESVFSKCVSCKVSTYFSLAIGSHTGPHIAAILARRRMKSWRTLKAVVPLFSYCWQMIIPPTTVLRYIRWHYLQHVCPFVESQIIKVDCMNYAFAHTNFMDLSKSLHLN